MLALSRNFQHALRHSNLPATPSLTQWGTRLTAHATPHSKGAYATLLTPTYDVYGFWVGINGSASNAAQSDQLLDLALGASQQNIIVPEYLCGWRGVGTTVVAPWQYFPIHIPAGVALSGRIQALITVDIADIVIVADEGASGDPGHFFSGCDAIGTNAAASQGTSHTPGDSGAESTAANIGSPTARDYGAIALGLGGTLTNTTTSNLAYHWEVLLGGQVIAEWYAFTNANEAQWGPSPPTPFRRSIPAGSQLQIQAECSGASAQPQDVALYGFY